MHRDCGQLWHRCDLQHCSGARWCWSGYMVVVKLIIAVPSQARRWPLGCWNAGSMSSWPAETWGAARRCDLHTRSCLASSEDVSLWCLYHVSLYCVCCSRHRQASATQPLFLPAVASFAGASRRRRSLRSAGCRAPVSARSWMWGAMSPCAGLPAACAPRRAGAAGAR